MVIYKHLQTNSFQGKGKETGKLRLQPTTFFFFFFSEVKQIFSIFKTQWHLVPQKEAKGIR